MLQDTRKLLKSYLGLTGVLIGVNQASGQVVYYDYSPDTLIQAPNTCSAIYFDLDIDSDAAIDFQFRAKKCIPNPSTTYGCRSENLHILRMGSNGLIPAYYTCIANNSTYSNVCQVKQLSSGYVIGNNANFQSCSMLRNWDYCTFQQWLTDCGTWDTGVLSVAGLKFYINGQVHYGWVRIQILSKSSCKILDYAYQSQPGAPMAAGSTVDLTTSTPELDGEISLSVYDKTITILTGLNFQNIPITISDLLGRTVCETTVNSDNNKVTVDKMGIYTVSLNLKNSTLRKKVFVH
jgi:hypothetical protein